MANVKITWDDVAGANYYNIYFIETTNGDPEPTLTPETGTAITEIMYTIYHHSGLIDGKRYYYIIAAVGPDGTVGPQSEMVSVVAETIIPEVILTSIEISPTTATIFDTEQVQYAATGHYSDLSTAIITGDVLWESSDEGIATIDSSGLATSVSAGTVTITATIDEINDSVELIVIPMILQSISITPENDTLDIGLEKQYTAIGHYSNATTADITGDCSWSSSNETAATIDNSGLATGMSVEVEVIITGTNFVDGCNVWFGDTEAISVTFIDSTSLIAVAPAHAVGPVEVIVINPDNQQDEYSSFTFE